MSSRTNSVREGETSHGAKIFTTLDVRTGYGDTPGRGVVQAHNIQHALRTVPLEEDLDKLFARSLPSDDARAD